MNRHDYESLTVPLHDEPRPHHDPLELQPLDQSLRYRQAPRIPRDTEPCPLWVFALIVAGCVGCLAMVAGWLMYGAGEGISEVVRYADAFVVELVRWIGGVL